MNTHIQIITLTFVIIFSSYYKTSIFAKSTIDKRALDDGTIDLTHFGPAIFGTPSEKTGDKVAKWTPDQEVNPDELSEEYIEGDILIPQSAARSGIALESARWPDGVVPYEISGYFSNSELNTIKEAMDDYHNLTCIKFVQRQSTHQDYLQIKNARSGCWSSVGRIGGAQVVNLQSGGCLAKKGIVIHELMHALGFFHEQNRPERDHHVIIHWDNIQSSAKNNFIKMKEKDTNSYGVMYDYRSVMHYSDKAFSINNKRTIEPKINGVELGQRIGFSRHDVVKINKMYNCTKSKRKSNGFNLDLFGASFK